MQSDMASNTFNMITPETKAINKTKIEGNSSEFLDSSSDFESSSGALISENSQNVINKDL